MFVQFANLAKSKIIFWFACNIFADVRFEYINNIMRNRANFINYNLEEKCTLLMSNFWKETRNLYIKRDHRERKVYVLAIYLLGTTYTFFVTHTDKTD